MSLENLKSAYGNISLSDLTPKKEGKDVNPLSQTPPKQSQNVVNAPRNNLENLTSKYGISNQPQTVDNMSNEKGTGFTPNYNSSLFTGIKGKSPNVTFSGNTLAYTDRNVEWPGPVDFIQNQKVKGFTLDQVHKSPSLYKGVKDGEKPIAKWINNLGGGGSLFGINEPPQEFNFIWDEGKEIDYTLGSVTHPGPTNFQTITSMWTNQLTGLDFPDGFTLNMKDSELVKGYRTLSVDGTNFRNTNWYDVGGYSFTNTPGRSDVNNFYVGFDSVTPSQFSGIPNPLDSTWTPSTNYYDSIHTQNSIYNNFPGPVDFMSGMSLHPLSLATSGSVDGFTNNYNPGMFGGWSTDEPKGDSKILGLWNNGEVLTSLWTGYGENNTPIDFVSQLDFVDGADVLVNSTLPEIGSVDFMSGMSLHEASLAHSGSISGFDLNYNPGQFGGWTADNTLGDSKILGLWDTQFGPGKVLTSMWTGYQHENNTTVDFPGPVGNFKLNYNPSFPGGYSSENTIGDTQIPLDDYDNVITDMYSTFISGDENLTFNGENLFDFSIVNLRSGLSADSSKGSNKGGQPSPQFDILYNSNQSEPSSWQQSANEAKYGGPVQDGSNINNLERFNIKSDLWNTGDRVGRSSTSQNAGAMYNNAASTFPGFGLSNLLNLATLNNNQIETEYGGVTEPYIIDDIGRIDDSNGSVFFNLNRIQKDTIRISKFLSSPAGDRFQLHQNLMGTFQLYRGFFDAGSVLMNVSSPKEGLGEPMMNFTRDTGMFGSLVELTGQVTQNYTDYLNERADVSPDFGSVSGILGLSAKTQTTYAEQDLSHKPLAFKAFDWLSGAGNYLLEAMMPSTTPATPEGEVQQRAGINASSGINAINNVNNAINPTVPFSSLGFDGKTTILRYGDVHTLRPVGTFGVSNQEGMPFYFKDLRDGSYVQFRAYIEGLNESISPDWNAETYVGRSEPVYTYKNAEREIGFTLKLFANTKAELNSIYIKLNKLTSLCYPEYKQSETINYKNADNTTTAIKVGAIGQKMRMKPPLMKLRLGDLYGGNGDSNMLTGFLKTLTYNFPDNGPWEIEAGKTVPKYVECEIGYQVIHSEVPSLSFAQAATGSVQGHSFFGVSKKLMAEQNVTLGSTRS